MRQLQEARGKSSLPSAHFICHGRWPAGRFPHSVHAQPPRTGRYEKPRTQPAAWPGGESVPETCTNRSFDVLYETRDAAMTPRDERDRVT
jgi:hypothetical protein